MTCIFDVITLQKILEPFMSDDVIGIIRGYLDNIIMRPGADCNIYYYRKDNDKNKHCINKYRPLYGKRTVYYVEHFTSIFISGGQYKELLTEVKLNQSNKAGSLFKGIDAVLIEHSFYHNHIDLSHIHPSVYVYVINLNNMATLNLNNLKYVYLYYGVCQAYNYIEVPPTLKSLICFGADIILRDPTLEELEIRNVHKAFVGIYYDGKKSAYLPKTLKKLHFDIFPRSLYYGSLQIPEDIENIEIKNKCYYYNKNMFNEGDLHRKLNYPCIICSIRYYDNY